MGHEDHIFDISKLNLEGDFHCQVQQILQYIRLTKAEVECLQILFDDLQNTLATVWPGCEVHPFGSIVTGLGIKSSDMDCYISLPSWLKTPGDTYVWKAKLALMRRSHIFRDLFAITGAKVPIVKFYHVPTQRCCDISFKSPFGVENSKLLAHLLGLDKRVRPLTILIKYWARVHQLTGTNRIPNYTLTLLIIFYLQQKTILPPICRLQKNEHMIDNWNVAFECAPHVSGNSELLYELLGGFFKYYRDFRYDLFVICPFMGRPIRREAFEKTENVPCEYQLYRINLQSRNCQPFRLNSILCIQDPFEHNKNCSVAMYPKLVNKLMSLLKLSTDVYEKEKCEKFLWGILSVTIQSTESPVAKRKRHNLDGITKQKPRVIKKKQTQNFQNAFRQYKEIFNKKT